MMNVTGIITEYNPFHNGHLHHLKQARDSTDSDATICIINGNFMQRGTPAVTDKWSRTRMALENGVDLVIELPLVYGIRSAEFFAEGAVRLMAATKIIDSIVFGSEIGHIDPLITMAKILVNEPDFFRTRLKMYLNQGLSFPRARQKGLIDYLELNGDQDKISQFKNIISEPNNILGIEYIKAILKYNIPITPCTIKRSHNNYHSTTIKHKIASATAIRNILYSESNSFKEIKGLVPLPTWKILTADLNSKKIPIRKEFLGIMILSRLRQMSATNLTQYAEIENGLEHRIIDYAHKSGNFNNLIESIKTRAFTWTRIQRNLLHILFNLTADKFKTVDVSGPQYLRVLGFNKTGEKLLSDIKTNSYLSIITQPANYLHRLETDSNDPLVRQLSYDIMGTDIYSLLYRKPEKRKGHLDFYTPVIKYGF